MTGLATMGEDGGTGEVSVPVATVTIAGRDHRASEDGPVVFSDQEWGRVIGSDCRRLAEAYLGRPVDGRTVRASYFDIGPESWAAGRRDVECLVGLYDSDGNRVAIEGLLRDQPA